MRWVTDDPLLDAEGGTFERDINAWHEMPTPKKAMELIEINGFGPADIRAAVLVAVKIRRRKKRQWRRGEILPRKVERQGRPCG